MRSWCSMVKTLIGLRSDLKWYFTPRFDAKNGAQSLLNIKFTYAIPYFTSVATKLEGNLHSFPEYFNGRTLSGFALEISFILSEDHMVCAFNGKVSWKMPMWSYTSVFMSFCSLFGRLFFCRTEHFICG